MDDGPTYGVFDVYPNHEDSIKCISVCIIDNKDYSYKHFVGEED